MNNILLKTFFLAFILLTSCSNGTTSPSADEEQAETQEPKDADGDTGEDTQGSQGTVVGAYGQLSVSGKDMVDQNGTPVQLRGMSLFWSQWMGQFYTTEAVQWLKDDWNITVIRASMGVEDPSGYLENPETEKAKIFEIIDAAIEIGIYVIVDWHSHHAEDYLEESKIFFAEVAQKYGDQPNIIYETYNEPLDDVSWENTLKPYHDEVLKEIRKHDTDNIVIAGTRSWSQRVDEVIGNEIDDANIMYTLHYYAASHKQELRDIAQTAIDAGLPIFVTEYGVTEYSGDGFIDIPEVNTWWDFLDANNISWCNWSIADKEENSAALKPGASGTGNWPESQLTPSGLMVREELKAKNPNF